jgi:hypothetical protein
LNASSRASFLKADEEVSGTISKKQIPPLRCGMTTKTKSKNKKQKQMRGFFAALRMTVDEVSLLF